MIARVAAHKNELKEVEELIKKQEKQLENKLRVIGNLVHSSVPVSMNENDNLVIKKWGEPKPTTPYHHHELLHMIDGYSPEKGVIVAGHRGYFLKGRTHSHTCITLKTSFGC